MIRKLYGKAQEEAMIWLRVAEDVARRSLCLRQKCGAVIVSSGNDMLGFGYNSPPNDKKLEKCLKDEIKEAIINAIKNDKEIKITNPTCCLHAEERAVLNALENKTDPCAKKEDLFKGSCIYYVSLGKDDNMMPSGRPWCTRCSTLALDIGISEWCMFHAEGVWKLGQGAYLYSTIEYNEVSFNYHKPSLDDSFVCKK